MHATVLRLRQYEVPHYEAQNYQVKLFPYFITENPLPWTPLFLSLSQFLLPSSPLYLLLLTFLSLSPPLACLLCWCCSRQNDITALPVDCSVWKLNVYVCVCMYARAEINSPVMRSLCNGRLGLKNHHFYKGSIVCVCVCVTHRERGKEIRERTVGQWYWRVESRHMVVLVFKNGSWDLNVKIGICDHSDASTVGLKWLF